MGNHKYSNDKITVEWDSNVCIHAAECIKNLNTVFDTSKRPWINVDAANNEEIVAAILKWQGRSIKSYGVSISIEKITMGFVLFGATYIVYLIRKDKNIKNNN